MIGATETSFFQTSVFVYPPMWTFPNFLSLLIQQISIFFSALLFYVRFFYCWYFSAILNCAEKIVFCFSMWSLSDVIYMPRTGFFLLRVLSKNQNDGAHLFFTVVRVKSVLMFGLQFLRWPAFRTVWLFQTYSAVGRTVENADNVQESTSRVLLWAIALEAGISHIWISPIGK